jgi:hypothetical protein
MMAYHAKNPGEAIAGQIATLTKASRTLAEAVLAVVDATAGRVPTWGDVAILAKLVDDVKRAGLVP